MKRFLLVPAAMLALITPASNALRAEDEPEQKVRICHIPPGNPGNAHEIVVGISAVADHIANHGDYIGSCVAGPGPSPS